MRHVIVTGAGKGLGKAIARQLLDDGWRVLAVDRDAELLSSLDAEFGNDIECHQVDVADHDAIERLFTSHADLPLQALVNNAGILAARDIRDYSPEEIARVIDVNLKGAIYFSKFFVKALLSRKAEGSIVN